MRSGLTHEEAKDLLRGMGVGSRVALLGLRGFYPLESDASGIYSDLIVLLTPSIFAIFNANTDASRHRNASVILEPGVWKYRLGIHGLNKPKHKQYMALVQADPVSVSLNGRKETGWYGINIHRGGYTTTSGAGCQTIFPDQWPAFIATVEQEMKREGHVVVPYALSVYR